MSRREPTHALFVASLTTAAAMLALQMVGAAASAALPLHLGVAATTWIAVGGVAALVFRMTGARPRVGTLGRSEVAAALAAGVALAVAGTGAMSVERVLVPSWEPIFLAKEAFFVELIRPGELAFVPVVLFVAAVGPALCEEVLFRGVLRTYLARHVGLAGRVLALGLLFSLLHGDVTVLVPMAWVGAMLTVAAERSGGWGTAAVAHFALNGFNAGVLPHVASGFEPGLWGGVAMVAVGGAAAVVAIAAIGRSGTGGTAADAGTPAGGADPAAP